MAGVFDPSAYAVAAQGERGLGEAGDLIFAWAMAEGLLVLASLQAGEFPLEAVAGPASGFCRLRVHFRQMLDPPQSRLHHMREDCWLTRFVRGSGGMMVQGLPVGGPVVTG
jgi:hypothetical protein